MMQRHREGLRTARMLMVLSSVSPLFILWAIRGNNVIPDLYFVGVCMVMVALPNMFLWMRIRFAKKARDKREIVVGTANDHRDHLLVYLFAMLLPFYAPVLCTVRDLVATLAALSFIVFLFWHLNLHYMNLMFAVRGYRVYTVYPPVDNNPITRKTPNVIITRRLALSPSERLNVYRLSDTVYMELEAE